ncbi:MAG: hypothetical protein ACREXR_05515, partial [Gammaproteobacteria bacterium]
MEEPRITRAEKSRAAHIHTVVPVVPDRLTELPRVAGEGSDVVSLLDSDVLCPVAFRSRLRAMFGGYLSESGPGECAHALVFIGYQPTQHGDCGL